MHYSFKIICLFNCLVLIITITCITSLNVFLNVLMKFISLTQNVRDMFMEFLQRENIGEIKDFILNTITRYRNSTSDTKNKVQPTSPFIEIIRFLEVETSLLYGDNSLKIVNRSLNNKQKFRYYYNIFSQYLLVYKFFSGLVDINALLLPRKQRESLC